MRKHLSLARIRQVLPHFNKKIHTEEDFWRVAKRHKIIVREMPMEVDGYHQRKRGRYYILINRDLRGIKWLHTAFHELCHFLLDVPVDADNYVMYRRRLGDDSDPRERFADAFATICIMPWDELVRLVAEEQVDEHHTLLSLCRARMNVKVDYDL